jgi:hypothetical protein
MERADGVVMFKSPTYTVTTQNQHVFIVNIAVFELKHIENAGATKLFGLVRTTIRSGHAASLLVTADILHC